MLNLQPLITRLVDDVLRAIRGATLAELRGVLGSPRAEGELARKPRATGASPIARPRAKASPARRSTLPPAPVASAAAPRPAREPEPHSEITDPERLLAATRLPHDEVRAPHAPQESQSVEPEAEPASGPVSSGAAARLRAGESLANTSGTGVVIRRAKKT